MSLDSFIAAADTTNMQAGGGSFFDTAADVLTKGAAAATISGLYGIVNTGIDLSNKVFGTELERADTLETLNKLDLSYGDYYAKNKDVIDTAGFFGASLIPGTLAVKGLKALQAGEATGAFGRALGFAASKETSYLNASLKELAVEGGTVFTRINKNKLLSMAWGTADQALQVAAFETAAAITMKSSPMLENEDWSHVMWDVVKTSVIGGGIGGGLNAIFTNKLLKDAGKIVDSKQREFDVIKDIGDNALARGDKAYMVLDALSEIPKEIGNPVVKLKHGRPGVVDSLDLTGLLEKTQRETVQRAVLKFETTLAHFSENDKSIGTALTNSFVGLLKKGIENGADDATIRAKLGEYLWNLEMVTGIDGRSTKAAEEIVHFLPRSDITAGSPFRRVAEEGSIPLRVISTETPRIGTLGKEIQDLEAGFKAGFDLILDPKKKTFQLSPFTKIFERISDKDASLDRLFFNTITRTTAADTVATIGDMGAMEARNITVQGVTNGDKTFAFKTADFRLPADSVEASARHLWAARLPKFFGSIESEDVSVLDALLREPLKAQSGLTVLNKAEGSVTSWSDIINKEAYVFQQKYDLAIKLLDPAKIGVAPDLRDIAIKLNVSEDWIEKAVAARFSTKELFADAGWRQDANRFFNRENLIFSYRRPAEGASPEGIVAYNQRVKEATIKLRDASDTVLGEDAGLFIDINGSLTKFADAQTVGAGGFTASNAGYGDNLRSMAQYTGLQLSQVANKRSSAALASLQSSIMPLMRNPAAAAEVTAAVTSARLSGTPWALYQDGLSKRYSIVDLASFNKFKAGGPPQFKNIIPLMKESGDFLAAHHSLHQARVEQHNVLAAAQGYVRQWDPNLLYLPPVDTRRLPFFAFVRQSDGSVFGSSEVAMITARNAGELQSLAAQVEKKPGFRVIYKSQTEDYFKAKRDYDFSRTMNSPVIDSTLRKEGQLGNYLPTFTPEAVVEDFVNYTLRAETQLVRDAVSVRYSQTIAELEDLSRRYTAAQTSKFEGMHKLLQRGVADPFDDAIKLMHNIGKRSEFTLWHEANEFVDALGTKAFQGIEKATLDARGGKIDWHQANEVLSKFGVGKPFADEMAFDVAQTAQDRNLIKLALNKANMLLATGMLRLDFANAILNVVSTPILLSAEVSAIRNSLKNDPELFATFNKQFAEVVPGTKVTVPSTTRLLMNAVGDLVSERGKELMARFKQIGTVKGPAALYHDMVNDLSLTPKIVPSKFAEQVDKWAEKGATLTGNNLAEDYTRFVSSHVMWQITEPIVRAGKMTTQEQNAFVSIFTNRVQGNYIASQRPMAFQGTLGSAIGLFQTYQFNLLQQLYRHIENKDLKTVAVMAGMQGSLFGLNGLPFFQAINTQIIGQASINEGHNDAYSYAVKAAGKEFGDWLLYGTASAFPLFSEQAPALWTRGDLNPRSAFVLPTSPQDVPAVQASLKVINTLLGMGSQISKGGELGSTLLFGLEHNGVNRPLAGLAQVLQGQATTNKGNLIAASSDWASIATFSRVLGAKPMDESIALNELYRQRAYQAMDKEKLDALGTVVKQKLRKNEPISSEDWTEFMGSYVASGGRIQGFAQAVQRWQKASNTSLVNEVMRHTSTPAGQRMIEAMGGTPLYDYRLHPAENE